MSPAIRFLLLLPLFLFGPYSNGAHAQVRVGGVLQNYNAAQTTGDHDFIAGRSRVKLQLSSAIPSGDLHVETDLIHRYVNGHDAAELLLREAYFDRYYDKSDLRVGKQVLSWGHANGAFVTDILSPADLREFLTLDPADLRLGVTAFHFRRYFDANSLQFIFNPVHEPDLLPGAGSRWFPLQAVSAPVPLEYNEYSRGSSLFEVQAAVRYSFRSPAAVDMDLMLMHWTHPAPAFALNINLVNISEPPAVSLDETYHTSPMAGSTFEWLIHGNWKLQTETLFVVERLFTFLPVSVDRLEESLEDPVTAIQVLQEFQNRDDGYLLKKPWLHSMVGVETEYFNTLINFQFYLETIFNYEGRILSQQQFPYTTFLLTRSFLRDRLQVVSAGRYNFFADDFWFQLRGVYEIDDGLELSLGTNLFGGEPVTPFYGHFSFNRFRENSFIFSKVAVYF